MALLNSMKDSSSSSNPEPDFLPIGYRFSPSPAQFVKLFLCNWMLSRQLPLNHIKYIKYLFELDADQVPKGMLTYIVGFFWIFSFFSLSKIFTDDKEF